MSDDGPQSVILRYLRALDARAGTAIGDMRDVKGRLSGNEDRSSTLERLVSFAEETMATFDVRLERIGPRPGSMETIPN